MGVSYDKDLRDKAKAEGKKLVSIAVGGTVWQEAVTDAVFRKVMRFSMDISEGVENDKPKEAKVPAAMTLFDDDGPGSDE